MMLVVEVEGGTGEDIVRDTYQLVPLPYAGRRKY